MAKKQKAVYAPGELDRVRGKLGELDADEAKRMARILGGEVGYERTKNQESDRNKPKRRTRRETVELIVGSKGGGRGPAPNQPWRRVEVAEFDDDKKSKKTSVSRQKEGDPSDDPAVPVKTPYFERVKIDKYCATPEFDIKSSTQALVSMLSLFSEPRQDYVSSLFVNKRFNEYYRRIESLVVSTRTLFPRNNMRRNERLKKASPFIYSILDTIRYINLERITGDLAKIQSHPRHAKIEEFAEILKAIYKPLFILEKLDPDIHIKGAYKILYKMLYIENPMDAKEKYQDLIRTALASFAELRRDVHYFLYPMLLKLLSDRWLPYERFFVERRNRFMRFINAAPQNCIQPADMTMTQVESGEVPEAKETEKGANGEKEDEDPDDPEVQARKAKQQAREAEKRALDQGFIALEALFPKAGWDRLALYPDLYPYFSDVFNLRKGYELIAPTDPLQQVAVLMHILDELCFGLRYISFGTISGPDGSSVKVEDYLGNIVNNWEKYINESFEKGYLPRLQEYCHILENSAESRTSNYAKRTLNELHYAKRFFFLPFYKFESVFPPTLKKSDVIPIYPEIRLLRKYLTAVASGIEQANSRGGAEKRAPCDGIDNPWEPYNFEVSNPVSKRLDALLDHKKKNNAALIFFSLAVVTVLDHLTNNESSWAYGEQPGPLFRSVDGEGITPLFGVENKIDADLIFKQTIKQRDKERQKAADEAAKADFQT